MNCLTSWQIGFTVLVCFCRKQLWDRWIWIMGHISHTDIHRSNQQYTVVPFSKEKWRQGRKVKAEGTRWRYLICLFKKKSLPIQLNCIYSEEHSNISRISFLFGKLHNTYIFPSSLQLINKTLVEKLLLTNDLLLNWTTFWCKN